MVKKPDTLTIKLMSLAIHAEEYLEDSSEFDRAAIRGILADPEVMAKMEELDGMGLLPVKR